MGIGRPYTSAVGDFSSRYEAKNRRLKMKKRRITQLPHRSTMYDCSSGPHDSRPHANVNLALSHAKTWLSVSEVTRKRLLLLAWLAQRSKLPWDSNNKSEGASRTILDANGSIEAILSRVTLDSIGVRRIYPCRAVFARKRQSPACQSVTATEYYNIISFSTPHQKSLHFAHTSRHLDRLETHGGVLLHKAPCLGISLS